MPEWMWEATNMYTCSIIIIVHVIMFNMTTWVYIHVQSIWMASCLLGKDCFLPYNKYPSLLFLGTIKESNESKRIYQGIKFLVGLANK